MKKQAGLLITFEGIEGSGKTTQLARLKSHLEAMDLRVETVREPGGTPFGQAIREILLHGREDLNPVSEALLFMASRAQLVRRVIRPWMDSGVVVLCDRWADATIAYQGYGSGLSVAWLRSTMKPVTDGIRPDLTFWMDVPAKTGLGRARDRGELDRMESREMAFHRRVLSGYRAIAKAEPERIVRIPVSSDIEKTAGLIRRRLERALGSRLSAMKKNCQ